MPTRASLYLRLWVFLFFQAYKVAVCKTNGEEDPNPPTLERRYNEFLSLYNRLRKEFPNHLSALQFPRKAIVGNFSPEMISTRSAGFETFLSLIGSESLLRHSKPVVSFLQDREIHEAIRLVQLKNYEEARPLVENSFHLMNKVETDRAPSVLRWLCLFVCVAWLSGDKRAAGLAGLAIRRYQAVSDVDLLRYYIPLLHTAEDICIASGLDTHPIREQLEKLRSSGMSVARSHNLLTLLLEDLSCTTPTNSIWHLGQVL